MSSTKAATPSVTKARTDAPAATLFSKRYLLLFVVFGTLAITGAVIGIVLATTSSEAKPETVQTVTMTLTASGEVSDYNAAKITQMRTIIARTIVNVSNSDIDISVAAASVMITAMIYVPRETTVESITTSLTTVPQSASISPSSGSK
jgi:hypothetical protein